MLLNIGMFPFSSLHILHIVNVPFFILLLKWRWLCKILQIYYKTMYRSFKLGMLTQLVWFNTYIFLFLVFFFFFVFCSALANNIDLSNRREVILCIYQIVLNLQLLATTILCCDIVSVDSLCWVTNGTKNLDCVTLPA